MYWNVFEQMNTVFREMNRIFSDCEYETFPFSRMAFLPGLSTRGYPLVNVSEDKDNLYVEALAPGLVPDSLEVTIAENTLTISGEKQSSNGGVKSEAYHRKERAAGKFLRKVDLPMEINGKKVSADYKNGLLMVALPKSEKAKPRQINISAS